MKCSESGHDHNACNSEKVVCVNYVRNRIADFNHRADDRKCPIFLYEGDIKRIMAQRNLNHKDAEQVLRKNGGIPPKKPVQRMFSEAVQIDMNVLINKAKDIREIQRQQKEQRFRGKQEKRDKDRAEIKGAQFAKQIVPASLATFVNVVTEKRKLVQYDDILDANDNLDSVLSDSKCKKICSLPVGEGVTHGFDESNLESEDMDLDAPRELSVSSVEIRLFLFLIFFLLL